MSLLKRLFANRPDVLPQRSEHFFEPDTESMVTSVPKILWIELTSKCPFKCVFCTREVRWGNGRNLDFEVYRSLIQQLDKPEFIGLNYSGESIHYPRLMESIALACSTGAYTELVTALSSAPQALVQQIVRSDLDRLAVSIHSLDDRQYQDIYGFGSLGALKQRIDDVIELKALLRKKTPKLDFCFVAMSQNLDQLLPVCRYAIEVGAAEISIHPIIGRHPVAYDFSRELDSNRLTTEFKDSLRQAVAVARAACPTIPITVLNPDLDVRPMLRPNPHYYAPSLPVGGRIHSCDQSPFESIHVLANGDVVVCEVHDEVALGNLHSSGIREIWHSERYRQFRQEYVTGANPACRDCVWKTAYMPEPWESRIDASKGMSPQLARGWYAEPGAAAIWSKKRCIAEFRVESPTRRVRIAGMLPHDPEMGANTLVISYGGHAIASIENRTEGFIQFDRTIPLVLAGGSRVALEFTTSHVFRPSANTDSADCRDLGFALQQLELK